MKTLKIKANKSIKMIKPSKILCVGRNYVEHIKELGNEIPDEMVVFFKPNSAISTQLNTYHLNEQLHYEGEICFVYEKGKFSAVGFGLDLTKRSLQSDLKSKGLPWERAKAFDGSVILSDFVSLENHTEEGLELTLKINGKVRQQGGVKLMMYKPKAILKALQTFVTLEEGDIVMTGTPKGVGVINAGDIFEASIMSKRQTEQGTDTTILLKDEWVAQ